MQISRLFEIVYILINRKRVTAAELAERFEVSTRTIYRDINALAQAGVPVYTTQGLGGGICISDAYVLSKSALTDEEQSQILLALGSLSATGHYRADALLSRLGSLFDKDASPWIEVDFTRW
ncbi:MAG: HTH domain-containing protein, partial [Firmicutes bacterium]|nr:HTH domain-containing protein [Bacillota bacterium]